MTSSEKHYHTQEFTQTYEQAKDYILPEALSGYRLVSCLSDGEFKKTWILEKSNGQRVLCKYSSGEYVDMLRTESEFFHLGKFTFVPYVYDYFETSDGAYLLREYIDGRTLYELVEKEGPMPLNRAVPLMEQLCGHLIRFHASVPPIIYRDLKPANIVLQDSGDCYLIDLGTVRTYHEDDSADTVFIGTTGTAAPEQFGARQTDARTDIYALGILFYYLLTGEVKLRDNHLKKLPSKAARIIRRCTAFDPNDRYSEVSMVIDALHGSARTKMRCAIVCAAIFAVIALTSFWILPKYSASREVVFTSALLEQAVRSSLGKSADEPVYERDLETVTHLYICGNESFTNAGDHYQHENSHEICGNPHGYGDITDISLLQKMPNLHTVVLDYQRIYDISPLEDLDLIGLSLCGNPITDLSALQDQKALSELYLSETGVASLESLEGCNALTILDCSYTSVTSTEPLALLPIRSLFLTDAPVSDYETLSVLPLEKLYVSHVAVEDLIYFENISTLSHLTLTYCGITSLNEVAAFSHLYLLDVNNNHITDLDGLEQFTGLHFILLDENPITDYTPLTKMHNLMDLGLPGTVTDFTFLNEMPWVQRVFIKPRQTSALYEAVPEPWFELVYY